MFSILPIFTHSLVFLFNSANTAGEALFRLQLELPQDQIVRIAVFVVILIVLWFILKTVLRVTLRFFAFGCGAILILGLVLVLMRIFSQ